MDLIADPMQEMRRRKDWKNADETRHRLEEAGFAIEDPPQGTKWKT